MLVGITPYFSTNRETLEDNILHGKLKMPRKVSDEVKDLIIGLLNRNPRKRLGSSPGEMGAHEIMRHPFFTKINWQLLADRNKQAVPLGHFWPSPPKY